MWDGAPLKSEVGAEFLQELRQGITWHLTTWPVTTWSSIPTSDTSQNISASQMDPISMFPHEDN